MPEAVVRGFAGTAQSAFDAVEDALISWIKGYISDSISYEEAVVITNS